MQTTTLGRTGLTVSIAGLGCGGHSRLGQAYGNSTEQSVSVVKAAIDAGVNFIDTAAAYGTEEIVGQAVRGCRDQVVISSKQLIFRPGTSNLGQDFKTPEDYAADIEKNLKRLGTDYIDIFHPHGIMPDQYDYCVNELVPVLLKFRDQGKIRFLGLTERFIFDPQHKMLSRALEDDFWDVVMTGFNLINPSAQDRVFAKTLEKNIGTLVMFAVRRALSNPQATREIIGELIDGGHIDASSLDQDDPLGFLAEDGVAGSIVEAAYRFCRHQPGAHVILTGTGSVDHLLDNLTSIQGGPLPGAATDRLRELFGRVDSVSGN